MDFVKTLLGKRVASARTVPGECWYIGETLLGQGVNSEGNMMDNEKTVQGQ